MSVTFPTLTRGMFHSCVEADQHDLRPSPVARYAPWTSTSTATPATAARRPHAGSNWAAAASRCSRSSIAGTAPTTATSRSAGTTVPSTSFATTSPRTVGRSSCSPASLEEVGMNQQTASALKSAADREGALLRHLALCRELQEAVERLPASSGDRERLEKALRRARLITLHFADSFCDAFHSDIATRLGLAPPAD